MHIPRMSRYFHFGGDMLGFEPRRLSTRQPTACATTVRTPQRRGGLARRSPGAGLSGGEMGTRPTFAGLHGRGDRAVLGQGRNSSHARDAPDVALRLARGHSLDAGVDV